MILAYFGGQVRRLLEGKMTGSCEMLATVSDPYAARKIPRGKHEGTFGASVAQARSTGQKRSDAVTILGR